MIFRNSLWTPGGDGQRKEKRGTVLEVQARGDGVLGKAMPVEMEKRDAV